MSTMVQGGLLCTRHDGIRGNTIRRTMKPAKYTSILSDTAVQVEELFREVASKRPVAAILPANAPMAAAPKA
jgi:hypothetical protein